MKRGVTLVEIIIGLAIVLTIASIISGVVSRGCSKSDEIEEKGGSADRVIVLEQKVDDLERRLEKLEKK